MILAFLQTQLLNIKKSCNKVNLNIYLGEFWPDVLQNLINRERFSPCFVEAWRFLRPKFKRMFFLKLLMVLFQGGLLVGFGRKVRC